MIVSEKLNGEVKQRDTLLELALEVFRNWRSDQDVASSVDNRTCVDCNRYAQWELALKPDLWLFSLWRF